MINKSEQDKRKLFTSFLKKLSREPIKDEEANTLYLELEQIYSPKSPDKEFRHFYSDIFSTLSEIEQNPDAGDLEILGANVDYILHNYTKKTYDISTQIKKLYDHVSLDIARINYVNAQYEELSLKAKYSESLADQSQERLKNVVNDLKDVNDKMERQQREYVAILGIFAAVVVAFVGGLVFSTSVFEGLGSANVYELIMIASVVGLVLMSILFALFRYISSIVKGEPELRYSKADAVSIVILVGIFVLAIIAWANGLFGAGT